MTTKGGIRRPQKKAGLRRWAVNQYRNRETWVRLVRRKRKPPRAAQQTPEPGLPEWPGLVPLNPVERDGRGGHADHSGSENFSKKN